MSNARWEPPKELSREDIIKASDEVLCRPDIPIRAWEDVIRIRAVGMDWDITCEIHEPRDPGMIPAGADGMKAGIFLLHGGMSDQRFMRPMARILSTKFGCKVVSMSFPGRLYLGNEAHDWPGDTVNPDGTARTPHWLRNLTITPDQYEVISDRSDEQQRRKRGTVFLARAREGTEFYYRMAGWPAAFEVGGIETCRRHFPAGEFTVYGHGRSAGGPFVNMLSQRVANWGGIGAMENSPFAYIRAASTGFYWNYPFNCLSLRTWRDLARYRGPEHGLDGAKRLPMLMEEILEEWDYAKRFANFKAEYMIHFNNAASVAQAARVTAKRLYLGDKATEALVSHYLGYLRELSGPGVKPIPPLLLGIAEKSVDHNVAQYQKHVLPAYAAMVPQPKVRLTLYHSGGHFYTDQEPGLPMGSGPATAQLWFEAITNGYYVVKEQGRARETGMPAFNAVAAEKGE